LSFNEKNTWISKDIFGERGSERSEIKKVFVLCKTEVEIIHLFNTKNEIDLLKSCGNQQKWK